MPTGLISFAVLPLVFLILSPRDAYAYVDPGTGSLAWQLILSGALGLVFSARRTVRAIWQFAFRRRNDTRARRRA
jgi:hypothetical protein